MSDNDFDDDGRTVFDMTFTKETTWYESFAVLHDKKRKIQKRKSIHDANIKMTKKETKSVIFSAVLAGLGIGLIFIIVFYLFLLFCVNVWFQ